MVQMLRHQDAISSNILLSVLEMCTDKSMENFTGQFYIIVGYYACVVSVSVVHVHALLCVCVRACVRVCVDSITLPLQCIKELEVVGKQ